MYSQSEGEPSGKPKLASQNQDLFPKQIQLCPSPVPCHLLVPFAPAGLPTACRGAPRHPMSRKCQGVELPTVQLQPNPFSVGDTFSASRFLCLLLIREEQHSQGPLATGDALPALRPYPLPPPLLLLPGFPRRRGGRGHAGGSCWVAPRKSCLSFLPTPALAQSPGSHQE